MKEIYRLARPLKRMRHSEDIVCIIGGGNMGDLYRYEEWTRQFIMKTFKSYPVIQLPATAHFTETKRGKERNAALFKHTNTIRGCFSWQEIKQPTLG